MRPVSNCRKRIAIARPSQESAPAKEGPRVNDEIESPDLRLIGAEGEMLGVVNVFDALQLGWDAGLDVVEVSPNAEPPVAKLLDFGKFKYEQQKKANEARKKQKVIEIKEIKMRPGIDDHDYDVKKRAMVRFLEEGDKVKVTLRFRGREMVHQELGHQLLERLKGDLGELAKVEAHPRMEGRQMTMVVAPK
ncbi:MAG: translation initiation factor IF-3 [Alphaproteobacteria bacterium]|nr:translation initiation factor IF-3 [Alphaproteobacteria bacterium]